MGILIAIVFIVLYILWEHEDTILDDRSGITKQRRW